MRHEAGTQCAQLALIVHSETLAPGRPVPAARPNTAQPTESWAGTVVHQQDSPILASHVTEKLKGPNHYLLA
jgi:hypothetical protein